MDNPQPGRSRVGEAAALHEDRSGTWWWTEPDARALQLREAWRCCRHPGTGGSAFGTCCDEGVRDAQSFPCPNMWLRSQALFSGHNLLRQNCLQPPWLWRQPLFQFTYTFYGLLCLPVSCISHLRLSWVHVSFCWNVLLCMFICSGLVSLQQLLFHLPSWICISSSPDLGRRPAHDSLLPLVLFVCQLLHTF